MVEEASGRVVGIDFGHAFGSATHQLPQPELMGVRLTRQLTSFLRPLDSGVLLKGHMVLVLRTLRAQRDELLRVMDVFVSEPNVDWAKQARTLARRLARRLAAAPPHPAPPSYPSYARSRLAQRPTQRRFRQARKLGEAQLASVLEPSEGESQASTVVASEGGGAADGDRDAAWARNRLASVVSKLSGGNAAHITEAELRLNPVAAKPATFDRLVEIVRGPADSLRRQLPATALTPEQQARCGPRYRPPPRTR